VTLKHSIFRLTCQIPGVLAVTRIETGESGGAWIISFGEVLGVQNKIIVFIAD